MRFLHGTWIPDTSLDFVQRGQFCLWLETDQSAPPSKKKALDHPRQTTVADASALLTNDCGLLGLSPLPRYFLLPSADDQPLPSIELTRYLEVDTPESFVWQYWQVDAWPLCNGQFSNVIRVLNDLHFLISNSLVADLQLGTDLLFWYHYSQFLKQIILKDQYIPALKYRLLEAPAPAQATKKKTAKTTTKTVAKTTKNPTTAIPKSEIYGGWEIISAQYTEALPHFVEMMPLVCTAGWADLGKTPALHDPESLLRHFSHCILTDIVTHTPRTAVWDKKIAGTIIEECLQAPQRLSMPPERYQQWQAWRDRINRSQTALPFFLCFQLYSPDQADAPWLLEIQVTPRSEPSVRLPLQQYWEAKPAQQKKLRQQLGEDFEQNLLMNLGYAARMYAPLWAGLETDRPTGIQLTSQAAADFLQEPAWVLEDSGYKVIVPAWWTPKGWQRAKIRLKAAGKKTSNSKSKSYFSLETLVDCQYELSIDGQPVTDQEWQELVQAGTSLVQFRGQWLQLDPDQMQKMLEFWKKHKQENPELSLADFMKMSASGVDGWELDVDRDGALAEMLDRLHNQSRLEEIADPENFQGSLRAYQKRGVAWLQYLETLGLNGCLADDMGMGKSAQVIARLVQERNELPPKMKLLPTLLVAPTSVVGNWQKEIEKFAPQLRTIVHHGSDRLQEAGAFKQAIADCDVLITSFTLVRKDEKLLGAMTWQRLVLDEAQNIKNPQAAQTKAILKLTAHHRLALTGTPVENRLLDLWSIFNFLNPGYLGKETQFRKGFEIPIQKENNLQQSQILKKLVEPFILRRVKTDPAIIQDLPDKVEQKLFCNLTKEQASLYGAVLKDVEEKLEEADGIQRRGLMLATLLKLKQICNHPRQFLQDDSDFTPSRSHKLERLTEMVQEVLDSGESMLIFSQFTEIGAALEKYLRQSLHCATFYLHGGVTRERRTKMIEEFQDPEGDPAVFILSLKAGGVGITLTKANHVCHFDRWWNPAVEDQATDRAFRIGQTKNVFVHKFVTIGTLEERIDQMIADKKKLAGTIVGADESWLTELDNNAFKELIALNRSAVLDD